MKNVFSVNWCHQTCKSVLVAGLVVLLMSTALIAADKKPADTKKVKITYDEHIKPIFRAKCFACHNTDKKQWKEMVEKIAVFKQMNKQQLLEHYEKIGNKHCK